MSVLFSRVELYNESKSLEFELFMGGIPRDYDDLEETDEFVDFMDMQFENTEMVVHTYSYVYGEGETVEAGEEQLDEIKERFDDKEWADNLTLIEEGSFTFIYDADELFGIDEDEGDDDEDMVMEGL
ncbi:MAG: hypothetical protein PHD46_07080 [Eubacteriales bacterium]|nr:hypothetical protein [Eubacteriales bacterium]